ncbi:MAG: hypothetical protein AB7U05_12170 [Mangrovibacterium sp.]
MEKFQTHQTFEDCFNELKKQDYTGFDPADLMNTSSKRIRNLPSPLIRLLTIINFLSPINFRKYLKIQPTQNTTAMVVMARALLNKYKETNISGYKTEAQKLEQWMSQRSISLDNSIGWARVIPYQSRNDFQHASQSSLTFINAFALELYLDLYELEENTYYLNNAKKIRNHIINDTNRINHEFGSCLSYINDAREEVLNASIIAGAALNRYAHIQDDKDAMELSLSVLDYVLYRQNADGSWEYSYKANGKAKRQYDFHQCYVLDSIKKYDLRDDDSRFRKVKKAFDLGINFYLKKQFDSKMNPFWRYPVKYPIDIHNVSHAIFFVAKYYDEIPESHPRLNNLLSLLYDEFYCKEEHYFYYQKYPFLTVKHNFFRWNTVWTLYALSHIRSR